MMMFVALFLWMIIVGLTILVISVLLPRRQHLDDRNVSLSAREILRRRYARGEIDADQYRRVLEDILEDALDERPYEEI